MYERPANRLEVHKAFTFGADTLELKKAEGREVYDTIILADDTSTLAGQEDKEITLAIRLLTPETHRLKYCTRVVRCKVSSDPTKYRDRLHVRYQRGLLHPKPWSVEILREETGLLTIEADATQART
jgi:hypothetical protein